MAIRQGIVLSFVAATLLAGCGSSSSGAAESTGGPAPDGRSYVLVHGAWMGGWAWGDVADRLKQAGAKSVTAIDLPGHGADATPVAQASLDGYVAAVEAAIDAAPQPVVLVGHSFGGVVVTQAAEHRADKIEKIVYLAALVPQNGESAIMVTSKDMESHAGKVVKIDSGKGVASIPMDQLEDVFCADCTAGELAELSAHYKDEPIAPLLSAVTTTTGGWGKVPKFYLYTKDDNAVTYGFQKTMTSAFTLAGSTTLDTSHSPFLSKPDQVVSALTSL